MGDVSDITPEIAEQIIDDISANVPYELAAEAAGGCRKNLI